MKVLVIPNYTNFGQWTSIGFIPIGVQPFLDNTKIGKEWEWILPYPAAS